MKNILIVLFIFLLSCSSHTISPMPDDMTEFFYLDTNKDTYFIEAKGLYRESIQKDMFNQMQRLINDHEYREYFVLSQGEISRTIFKPTLRINAWIKFFRTEKEYIKFSQTYNPFGQN